MGTRFTIQQTTVKHFIKRAQHSSFTGTIQITVYYSNHFNTEVPFLNYYFLALSTVKQSKEHKFSLFGRFASLWLNYITNLKRTPVA